MKLSAPKQIVFLIAVIALIVGIVLWLMGGDNAEIAFWLTAGGGVLLALATMLKGL